MKRNHIETVLGAVVLVVAIIFFGFSYTAASVGNVNGYELTADFTGIGGLGMGDSVQISGVKVGSIAKIELQPESYQARVTIAIDDSIKLPEDTSALISSESLLGGRYLELQPGASDEMLAAGDHISYTQAPQNLEQLLGKFIFSMDGAKDAAAEAPSDTDFPSEAVKASEQPALDEAPTEETP